jgi:hypothetical protein
MQTSTAERIRATVREAYGAVANQKQQGGCKADGFNTFSRFGSLLSP